jgi:hypothetical protein
MQAWGNYGTVWPVVHQQLGVRPFLPYGELQIVPEVPTGQPSVAGSNIRLGSGAVNVFAAHSGRQYTTRVETTRLQLRTLLIGHTLPAGSRVGSVQLDGMAVRHFTARLTNRGLEVTVAVHRGALHTLIVRTA